MQQWCRVCGEAAAGFHFGAFTCEGCKSFFGRSYNSVASLSDCKSGGRCVITKKNRTTCKSCRLRQCIKAGMSKSGSRYGRRSNWFKIHCLLQDQPPSSSSNLSTVAKASQSNVPASNLRKEALQNQCEEPVLTITKKEVKQETETILPPKKSISGGSKTLRDSAVRDDSTMEESLTITRKIVNRNQDHGELLLNDDHRSTEFLGSSQSNFLDAISKGSWSQFSESNSHFSNASLSLHFLAQAASFQNSGSSVPSLPESLERYHPPSYSPSERSKFKIATPRNSPSILAHDSSIYPLSSPLEIFHKVFGQTSDSKQKEEVLKAMEAYQKYFEPLNLNSTLMTRAKKREYEYDLPFSLSKRSESQTETVNISPSQRLTRVTEAHQDEPIDLSVRKESQNFAKAETGKKTESIAAPKSPVNFNERKCFSAPTPKTDYHRNEEECSGVSNTHKNGHVPRLVENISDFNHNSISELARDVFVSTNEGNTKDILAENNAPSASGQSSITSDTNSHLSDHISVGDSETPVTPSVSVSSDVSHLPLLVQIQAKACQSTAFAHLLSQYEKVYGLTDDDNLFNTHPFRFSDLANRTPDINQLIPKILSPMSTTEDSQALTNSQCSRIVIDSSKSESICDTDEDRQMSPGLHKPLVECSVVVSEVCAPAQQHQHLSDGRSRSQNCAVELPR